MSVAEKREVYVHGRDRTFTEEEYEEMLDELLAACKRDDEEAMFRLAGMLPADPDVLKAFAYGFGRDAILEIGYDLTEANRKFGEGWLDEFKP